VEHVTKHPPLWLQALLRDNGLLASFLTDLNTRHEGALQTLMDATSWEDICHAKGRIEEVKSLRSLVENYRAQEGTRERPK
jgi:hypothetical protein